MSNKEYIEREAFLQRLLNDCVARYPSSFYIGLRVAAEEIGKQPTADVVEVRHGEWEKDPIAIRDDGEIYDYRCSACTARAHKGEYGNYDYITDYCPNCGAKMDGKGEGE